VIAVLALLSAFGPWSSAAQGVYGLICCTVKDTTGAAIPKEHVSVTGLRKDPGKYGRFDYQVAQKVHAFARYDTQIAGSAVHLCLVLSLARVLSYKSFNCLICQCGRCRPLLPQLKRSNLALVEFPQKEPFMATLDFQFDGRDDFPPEPSAWEMLLLRAGVLESNCISLLASGAQEARAIRSWVHENYSRRYVPEQILDALGLRNLLRNRLQDND
jgi:hypothetical protein